MKRLVSVALLVVLAVTAFAMARPAAAGGVRGVFETDIVIVAGGTDPLTRGEASVKADGSIKVEIEGAVPNKQYRVLLATGPTVPAPAVWGPVFVTADGSGDFTVDGTVNPGQYGMPRAVIQSWTGGSPPYQTQFISGFTIP